MIFVPDWTWRRWRSYKSYPGVCLSASAWHHCLWKCSR